MSFYKAWRLTSTNSHSLCTLVYCLISVSSKAVVTVSKPSTTAVRSCPASQASRSLFSDGQSAPVRTANVDGVVTWSDRNTRCCSPGTSRDWSHSNDDDAVDIPEKPPRKQRERSLTGRRMGSACAPKRSPRLLLKTYLQVGGT